MQDLTIELDEGVLNCRAAAIINHNGKILFHKNTAEPHYALVGGRVQITERSDDTVKREIKEELGKDIEITGYICTIENLFNHPHNGKKYHEIMFVHSAEFIDDDDKKITETMQNIEEAEEEKHIQYEWIDLDKIDSYDIRPAVIKEILKQGTFPTHVVNYG